MFPGIGRASAAEAPAVNSLAEPKLRPESERSALEARLGEARAKFPRTAAAGRAQSAWC